MGIAGQLRAKTIKPETESVSEAVAAGDVELGIIVIPNIISVPGAQLVGPIPEAIQSWIVFTAAAAANSPHPGAARDLVAFLRSPAAVAAIKAKGQRSGLAGALNAGLTCGGDQETGITMQILFAAAF